jgi:hypothetical protein
MRIETDHSGQTLRRGQRHAPVVCAPDDRKNIRAHQNRRSGGIVYVAALRRIEAACHVDRLV